MWNSATRFLFFGVLVFVCCALFSAANAQRLRVLATTGIIADVAENIGKDRVSVTAMMGPGLDPHTYKASAGDLQSIITSEIILYNGLFLESKLAEILRRQDKAYAVAETIPREKLIFVDDDKTYPDPHVWFDLTLWRYAVLQIAKVFSQHRKQETTFFERNAQIYIERMDALDRDILSGMREIPEKHRVLITAHDAFAYYGERYGIEYKGIQGVSTVTEAGIRDIQILADYATDRKLPAIFVETSVSPKTVKALREAIIDRGHNVNIGGELYSDALGTPGSAGDTYLGMVRSNTDTIVTALRGQ